MSEKNQQEDNSVTEERESLQRPDNLPPNTKGDSRVDQIGYENIFVDLEAIINNALEIQNHLKAILARNSNARKESADPIFTTSFRSQNNHGSDFYATKIALLDSFMDETLTFSEAIDTNSFAEAFAYYQQAIDGISEINREVNIEENSATDAGPIIDLLREVEQLCLKIKQVDSQKITQPKPNTD